MGPMWSGAWAWCGLEIEPGMVWRLGLVWPGDWAWHSVETMPVAACRLPLVLCGPGELWRLGRYSQLTRSGTVRRLGPVLPGDWAHYRLEAEHDVAMRLWSLQSGHLSRCGLETGPGTVWLLSPVQLGDRTR
ncbi:hypothetical protein chiPu_0020169 [Chiloscyllium punctatum]|uniref:Uncharacterized protein n=1 Tax=Chiloscyllium punctatum TaxID=137246 RepID=A0A401RU70_CHIPU|nr:hypothetical protein [Chiloscyllium punctatum]